MLYNGLWGFFFFFMVLYFLYYKKTCQLRREKEIELKSSLFILQNNSFFFIFFHQFFFLQRGQEKMIFLQPLRLIDCVYGVYHTVCNCCVVLYSVMLYCAITVLCLHVVVQTTSGATVIGTKYRRCFFW